MAFTGSFCMRCSSIRPFQRRKRRARGLSDEQPSAEGDPLLPGEHLKAPSVRHHHHHRGDVEHEPRGRTHAPLGARPEALARVVTMTHIQRYVLRRHAAAATESQPPSSPNFAPNAATAPVDAALLLEARGLSSGAEEAAYPGDATNVSAGKAVFDC